jgi:hypothetical protein
VYSPTINVGEPVDFYAELDNVEGNVTSILDTAHFTINEQTPVQRTITVNLDAGARVSLRMYDPNYPNPSPGNSPDIAVDGQAINFIEISPVQNP